MLNWIFDKRTAFVLLSVLLVAVGVIVVTLAKSSAVLCSEPWQSEQSISSAECLLSFQSVTMLGVSLAWQSTQALAEAEPAVGAPPLALAQAIASPVASAAMDESRRIRVVFLRITGTVAPARGRDHDLDQSGVRRPSSRRRGYR